MICEKVFPLADALQLTIDVYRKGHDAYELRGNRKFVLPLSKKSDLNLSIKVEASYIGEFETAILVHIAKDFWIYVTFDNSVDLNGVLNLYYLSMDKLNLSVKDMKAAIDGTDIDTAMMFLRRTVVAHYTKGVRDIEWSQVEVAQKKIRKVAAKLH